MENPHTATLKTFLRGKTLVSIDAANFERSVKEMGRASKGIFYSIDYRKLYDFFHRLGAHQPIHYYTADFNLIPHRKFCYFLKKELNFHIVSKPIKEYYNYASTTHTHKANFDVEIAVDATHLLSNFDTFILFSGDADFEYLIHFLNNHGKNTIGFSYKNNLARELQLALTYSFDITDFTNDFLKTYPQ